MTTVLPVAGPSDLTECDREPIHTPGAIQPHGALIVCDAATLSVTHVSANLGARIGGTAADRLGLTIADVFDEPQVGQTVRALAAKPVGSASAIATRQRGVGLQLAMHRLESQLLIEIEPAGPAAGELASLGKTQALMQALRAARTTRGLSNLLAVEMRRLTGYDRVMVYHFAEDGHGEVVAEDRDPRLEPFLGLRYPASDVPAQARALYIRQRVRVIGDVDAQPARLLAADGASPASSVDLSACGLRSVSPLHVEYLRNMGVQATLAVSILSDDGLWGMLVCHHRQPMVPSPQVRALCDLVGHLVSLSIVKLAAAEAQADDIDRAKRLQRLVSRLGAMPRLADALRLSGSDLLGLVAADGAYVRFDGTAFIIGRAPSAERAAALMAGLRQQAVGQIVATECMSQSYPDLPRDERAAGALYLPLPNGHDDGILWTRVEIITTVTWGGDPSKAVQRRAGRLSPRASFAAYREVVRGRSIPWRAADRTVAGDLRRAITAVQVRQTEADLAQLRHFDPLTGLPNRRRLQELVDLWRMSVERGPAALIFLDIDRFKAVNDSLGQSAGDALLSQVANRLRRLFPMPHVVARLGADEFAAFCSGVGRVAAEVLAERVRQVFNGPFQLAGRPFRTSASVGVAHSDTVTDRDILRAADAAMDLAKRQGGNSIGAFEQGLHHAVTRRLELEQGLHEALATDGQLDLYYQPIVATSGRRTISLESLLRWTHPRYGTISPGEFIPIAEESGLIVKVGLWVLHRAVEQLAAWRARDPAGHAVVSINVSAKQLAQPGLASTIGELLRGTNLPVGSLCVEVTESVFADDAAGNELRAIHGMGVQVLVDDFGVGYSSLAALRRLPANAVKLDRSFIEHLGHTPEDAKFLSAIVRLAHAVGLRTVAEGVETEAQFAEIASTGCDAVQGFLIARPMPAAEAEAWLRR